MAFAVIPVVLRPQLGGTILERALACRGQQVFDGFDQRGQGRLSIRRDVQIDFGVTLKVLVIAFENRLAALMLMSFTPGL